MQIDSSPVRWAKDILKKRKYVLRAPEESVLKTPYSNVVRFLTSQGNIYLKETPPALFMEAGIIQILKNRINAMVPSILEINKELNCFLMLDAGIPLKEYFKINFQPNLLTTGIKQYTNIQSTVVGEINIFIKLGVPDWRLNKLPSHYRQIIANEEALKKDDLTKPEIISLQSLCSTFTALCDMLSQFKLPQSLDHCDFHDNNILINPINNQLTIIDLGEVVITHPFFSLISFISKTSFRYSLNEDDPIFIEMLDACFENWLSIATKEELKRALLLTKKLWPIYSALGYSRLISSSGMGMDETKLISYFGAGRNKGRFAKYFRDFINANLNLDINDLSHVKLSDPGSRLIQS